MSLYGFVAGCVCVCLCVGVGVFGCMVLYACVSLCLRGHVDVFVFRFMSLSVG